MEKKEYHCTICKNILERKTMLRLMIQKYSSQEDGTYGYFIKKKQYDFCPKCYSKINNWIKKYKED